MSKFSILDTVKLKAPYDQDGVVLSKGDVGTIVEIYPNADAPGDHYEVEFVRVDGNVIALIELDGDQMELNQGCKE